MPRNSTRKLFIDLHDAQDGTLPSPLPRAAFDGVFAQYEAAAREEGVNVVHAQVGLAAGRVYCVCMADDPEQVRKAHERVGLTFSHITEVETALPVAPPR